MHLRPVVIVVALSLSLSAACKKDDAKKDDPAGKKAPAAKDPKAKPTHEGCVKGIQHMMDMVPPEYASSFADGISGDTASGMIHNCELHDQATLDCVMAAKTYDVASDCFLPPRDGTPPPAP